MMGIVSPFAYPRGSRWGSLRPNRLLGGGVSRVRRTSMPRCSVLVSLALGVLTMSTAALSGSGHPSDTRHKRQPASPNASTPHGELVFSVKTWRGNYTTQDVPGGVQSSPVVGAIYAIRDDGTALRKVISLGKNTDDPTMSPDGHWLYFQSNATGHSQVYRCRPNGSGITNLTAGARLGPQWQDAYGYYLSADGKKLLYTIHNGRTGQVALANADGSHPRLVAPELGYTYMATLSPDNDRVVCSGPAHGYRLLLIRLADRNTIELTPHHPESFVPQLRRWEGDRLSPTRWGYLPCRCRWAQPAAADGGQSPCRIPTLPARSAWLHGYAADLAGRATHRVCG